ncbi:MAG: phosphoenolpyruvate--protein phosphotransferase [Bacteroidota bacterium]
MPISFASSDATPPRMTPREPDGAMTAPLVVAPAEPQRAPNGMRVLNGLAVAPGIAMGQAYVYQAGAYQSTQETIGEGEVEAEVARFEEAVSRAERELRKVIVVAREKIGPDGCALFTAQLMMLRDSSLYDATVDRIREDRDGAGYALEATIDRFRQRLQANADPRWRERVAELLDVQNRILRNLNQERALSHIDPDRIVVAENLTAADILLFSRQGIRGCVLDFGGPTSHVSLMARALGVPALVGLHGSAAAIRAGDTLILDGFSGRLVINPDAATQARYAQKRARYEELLASRTDLIPLPAETRDGCPVPLRANLEFREELPQLDEYGAEGVGLFRTELLFMAQGQALDEEEQAAIYRETIRTAAPHPVTFRLIDFGGDKVLHVARREPNPFLGWRGIRLLMDRPELLKPQLRAILRAAVEGPVRILIPMVTVIEEVRAFKKVLNQVLVDLAGDGIAHGRDVQVGAMIEVPAAALLAPRFAQEVDFLSIGTNDLTSLTLGVDRGNDLVADLYRELHPGVLMLIARTVAAANRHGITVSLCGEMASKPRMVPLLVGLGVHELSMSPAYLLDVKRVIRAMTQLEAEALAQESLAQPNAAAVGELLDQWLRTHNRELASLFDDDTA